MNNNNSNTVQWYGIFMHEKCRPDFSVQALLNNYNIQNLRHSGDKRVIKL